MKNCFTEHPQSVNETYWQHLHFSASCASKLFIASLAGFLHAVFPFIFIHTCSNIIAKLAGNYCKGARREGFVNKLNTHLPHTEKCSIRKDIQ